MTGPRSLCVATFETGALQCVAAGETRTTRMAAMLPNGFTWRRWPNGRGLFLGSEFVAQLLLHTEREAIVVLHPNLLKCRRVHFASEAAALRYAEAWATKWDPELRATYERCETANRPVRISG